MTVKIESSVGCQEIIKSLNETNMLIKLIINNEEVPFTINRTDNIK
jgi:hypothetical protein